MSKTPSPKQSSNGSAAEYIKVVEQLIDSDEEQKNTKKMTALKAEFSVLKKMHPFMNNQDKLQIFLRDPFFKTKVVQKLLEKGIYMPNGSPIIKLYLISTRYGASVPDQFDENDLLTLFQHFGVISNFYFSQRLAFFTFHQIDHAYIAIKTLNEFPISDSVRLCAKWCSEDEGVEAQALFISYKVGRFPLHDSSCAAHDQNLFNINPTQKHVSKFLFEAEAMPEFNLAQRIIGPRGKYLKQIIDRVTQHQPLEKKQTSTKVDSLIKIRLKGKGSGFHEKQGCEEKMHLFVSSKSKNIHNAACAEIDKLLVKILQEYKIQYQKVFRQHAFGVAYRLYCYEGNFELEVKQVLFEDIETKVDILSLQNQSKLSQKIIQNKIQERDQLRKKGLFQEADCIRDWLKARGVKLIDSKIKGKKCAWVYEF